MNGDRKVCSGTKLEIIFLKEITNAKDLTELFNIIKKFNRVDADPRESLWENLKMEPENTR